MIQYIQRPDFFIVGFPKCGTSALTEYLRQHPEIYIPDVKELNYFGTDLNFRRLLNRSPDWYDMTENKYLSFFQSAKDKKRIGEASVHYIYSKKAGQNILEFNHDADIIIMLRNPVDMIYSWHSESLYFCNEDINNFEEALNAETKRKKGKLIPKTTIWPEGLFYREMMKFSKHVKRYIEIFGIDKVHIIVFDDFKDNTENIYHETLRFLKVNTDFKPDFRVVNPNKTLRIKAINDFLVTPPKLFRPLGRALSDNKVLRGLIVKALKLFNTRYEPRPAMDQDLRERLNSEISAEIEVLGSIIGRDLTAWIKQ